MACKKRGHQTALCGGPQNNQTNSSKSKRESSQVKKVHYKDEVGEYHVILETFTCNVMGTDHKGALEIRGMMDGGSDRSCVTEDVLRQLKIKCHRSVKMACSRFMQEQTMEVEMGLVKLILKNRYSVERECELLVTPCIAGEIVTAPECEELVRKLPSQMDYADQDLFLQNRRQIKLLIGNDIYHELVNVCESKPVEKGLVLLKSFFGWIPSGNIKSIGSKRRLAIVLAKHYAWNMICHREECNYLKQRTNRQINPSLTEGIVDLPSVALGFYTMNQDDGVVAARDMKSPVGGVCCSLQKPLRFDHSTILVRTHKTNNPDDLENLWSFETIGIENPEKHRNDELALEHFKTTMYRDSSNRYVVRFPWKDTTTSLPTNYRMAVARLRSVLERTTPDKLREVNQMILDQLQENIIEDVPFSEKGQDRNRTKEMKRTHYLPHRWIQEKTKIRIVYDASAKTKTGISLNDIIHKGPNLTKVLIGQLLNFRLHRIALTADIKGAYLQIGLNELDIDATRFLWVKDIGEDMRSNQNLRFLRFARVPFGVNASAFLLNIVLQHHFSEETQSEYRKIGQNNFYEDNFVISVKNTLEGIRIYEYLTKKLNEIQMNLRDWATNDDRVLQIIPEQKRERTKNNVIKVLGIMWDKTIDMIGCKLDENLPLEGTKRNVLRYVASIYDPLGLFAPCVLGLKIFLQKCWKNKYTWDERLPEKLQEDWIKLKNEILEISKITLPRRYWNSDGEANYELHVFSDASKDAYACCAYLVRRNQKGNKAYSSLIFCKSRLAPPKGLTIPKLELMGAVIAKRTAEFLKELLDIQLERMVIWTDASTILQWLNSMEILQTFVQNRIKELRKTAEIEYRYVSGTENPADLATRGKPIRLLKDNELWWKRPEWLLHTSLWPKPPLNVFTYDTTAKTQSWVSMPTTKTKIDSLLNDRIEKGMSSWNARVRVFRNILKWKGARPGIASDAELLKLAETALIRELQRKHFKKEIKLLTKGIRPPTNLDVYLDSNKLIRCGGRLQHAQLDPDAINPILLPRDSPVTESYIRYIHCENGHVGTSHVLSKLRDRFWIVKGRAKVKSVIHRCVICRRWEGKSYRLPPIPPLPAARVQSTTSTTPFLHIGIDHFGPMTIRGPNNVKDSVHILIFACLVTRAIHLEVVPDKSGMHCLLVLNRFTSIRRVPQLIISDNALTFTFVQPLVGIKVQINDYKVQKFRNNNRIEWYFIPQYAPWYGGAYERLIGLVKRCFIKSYGRLTLSFEEIRTAMYCIMDIVNDRPLTYIPSTEIVKPLTPNHFLRLGPANVNTSLEVNPKPPRTVTGKDVTVMWTHMEGLLERYWSSFRHNYLTSLRERHRVENKQQKGAHAFLPTKGDVVLIEEPNAPRGSWRMGVISKVDKRQALALVKCIDGMSIDRYDSYIH